MVLRNITWLFQASLNPVSISAVCVCVCSPVKSPTSSSSFCIILLFSIYPVSNTRVSITWHDCHTLPLLSFSVIHLYSVSAAAAALLLTLKHFCCQFRLKLAGLTMSWVTISAWSSWGKTFRTLLRSPRFPRGNTTAAVRIGEFRCARVCVCVMEQENKWKKYVFRTLLNKGVPSEALVLPWQ